MIDVQTTRVVPAAAAAADLPSLPKRHHARAERRPHNELFERFVRLARSPYGGSDVAAILHATHGANRLDNFGVPPPAGTYALETLPVVGLFQCTYSMIMSCFVFQRSNRSQSYLGELAKQCTEREKRLNEALKEASREGKVNTAIKLRQDLVGLRAFKASVSEAQQHAWQDLMLPGGARFFAAGSIMSLAIDRAPTLIGTTALLPSVAGAVLGGVGGGLLSIFGMAWLARNVCGAYRAWSTPCYPSTTVEQAPDRLQPFLRACNRMQKRRRMYYSINTVASMAYIASQLGLAVASSGVAVPATMIPLLAGASATSMVAEIRWGPRCGAHNANTPHNDRAQLQSVEARSATWNLLEKERTLQRAARKTVVSTLPRHRAERSRLSYKAPWMALPKSTRYRLLRPIGLGGRLGAWCARDPARVDEPLRELMAATNRLEVEALRVKLATIKARLDSCGCEFDVEGDSLVNEYMVASEQAYDNEMNRLLAMEGLQSHLDAFVTEGMRQDPDRLLRWNRLRLWYLAAHGLTNHFFTYSLVRKHPEWFQCEARISTVLKRRIVTGVRLADDGLERAAQGFDRTLETQFANLVLGPVINRYERDAVLGLDSDARRADFEAVQQQMLHSFTKGKLAA